MTKSKSRKQLAARFIFTTARLHMVRQGLDDGQTYAEIAERLGTTRQRVRQAAEREGWAVAMASAGHNVYVTPKDAPKSREWVTTAKDNEQAQDFVRYLEPKLPDGLKATAEWGVKPDDVPVFDIARLVEKPNEAAKEGA